MTTAESKIRNNTEAKCIEKVSNFDAAEGETAGGSLVADLSLAGQSLGAADIDDSCLDSNQELVVNYEQENSPTLKALSEAAREKLHCTMAVNLETLKCRKFHEIKLIFHCEIHKILPILHEKFQC